MFKTFRTSLILTASFLLSFSGYGQADFHYRSVMSGSWGTYTTWESSVDGNTWQPTTTIPNSLSNTITILSNHHVVVGSNYTVDQLVVESMATLTVEIGLTIANGEGDDLQVFGTLIAEGPLSMSGNAVIKNGGIYVLDLAKHTSLPSHNITWAEGSTLKLVASSTTASYTVENINQQFYNFIWDGSAQAIDANLELDNSFQVDGKMQVLSTKTKTLILTNSTIPVSLNINGDFEIINLSKVAISSKIGPITLNIGSNLSIGDDMGTGYLRMGNNTIINNRINIGGDIIVKGSLGGINSSSTYKNGTICFTNTNTTQTITNYGQIERVNYIINPSVSVSSPTFNVDNGYTLTIKDNASLITNSNVIATVERQVSNADWNVPLDGWHLLSSPVNNQLLTSGGFLTGEYDFYGWSEPLNTWLNQKATDTITDFNIGKGYFVAYDNGGIKTFQGPLNVTSQAFSNLSLTQTSAYSGYHLLGNPFISAIDWSHSAWNRQQVGEVANVWNETAMNYLPITSTNPVIPSCQGFFVQVLSSNNSITIPTAARIHNNAPLNKNATSNMLHLRVNGESQPMYDETIIRFHDDATIGFDKYDGYEMAGSDLAPQIYTVIQSIENAQGDKLSVNALPLANEVSQLPLMFRPGIDDSYRLKVLSGTMNEKVWLEDKFLGIVSRLESDSSYTFQSLPTDDINRFILHFGELPGKSPGAETVNIYAVGKTVFIREIAGTTGEVLEYRVISTSGQTLAEGSGKGATLKVDLPKLPTGMYIVIVTNNNRAVHTGKVIL